MATRQNFFEAENYDLYDGTPPHSDLSTSFEAAQEIKQHIPTMQEEVLDVVELAQFYGCTDDEVELQLRKSPSSLRPRRRELVLLGRIVDSGERRKTRSGRTAKVWVTPQWRQQ